MSDTVFVTGATGFVGGHVVDALLERGYTVRALVRNGDAHGLLGRTEIVRGSLLATGALVPHLRGCRYVVHTAALYSFAPRDRRRMHQVNVMGTSGLLEAARVAGVERAVVTSSSAAVGPARNGPVDETCWANPHHDGASAYHGSKVEQERAALAARVPAVTVLPTAPIGARDRRPTPTGRMVLDVMRGRIRAYLDGGLNAVPVRAVAEAHVLALERGTPRERYLAGGVNLSLAELFALIAAASGRPAPQLRLPYPLALVAAAADEMRVALTGGEPAVPLEGVRMGRLRMYSTSAKAERELGYRAPALEPAIDDAVRWYADNGYA